MRRIRAIKFFSCCGALCLVGILMCFILDKLVDESKFKNHEITISLNDAEKVWYSSNMDVEFTVFGDPAEINYQWIVEDRVIKESKIELQNVSEYKIPLQGLDEGLYHLKIVAINDKKESVQWLTKEIKVDDVLHVENIKIDPIDTSWTNERVITISAEDTGKFNSGIKSIYIYLDAGNGSEKSTVDAVFPDDMNPTVYMDCGGQQACEYRLDLFKMTSVPQLENQPIVIESGYRFIKVIAEDVAGNRAQTVVGPYLIDNDKPKVFKFSILQS